MPTYEFRCKDCNALLEDFFPIAERPPSIQCPRCKGIALRMVSAPAVYFSWALPAVDKPFEGTGFDGAEGPNPETYKSTKTLIELGK